MISRPGHRSETHQHPQSRRPNVGLFPQCTQRESSPGHPLGRASDRGAPYTQAEGWEEASRGLPVPTCGRRLGAVPGAVPLPQRNAGVCRSPFPQVRGTAGRGVGLLLPSQSLPWLLINATWVLGTRTVSLALLALKKKKKFNRYEVPSLFSPKGCSECLKLAPVVNYKMSGLKPEAKFSAQQALIWCCVILTAQ